jgi:hypothetical protein
MAVRVFKLAMTRTFLRRHQRHEDGWSGERRARESRFVSSFVTG